MKKWFANAVKWIWEQIKEEITEQIRNEAIVPIKEEIAAPIREMSGKIDEQNAKIEQLRVKMEEAHQYDAAARECDLASLDDQICQQIEKCRQRRYTTAEDRRRVGRMHRAYQARGGNDGETEEYAIFSRLPTEEEWRQMHSVE